MQVETGVLAEVIAKAKHEKDFAIMSRNTGGVFAERLVLILVNLNAVVRKSFSIHSFFSVRHAMGMEISTGSGPQKKAACGSSVASSLAL